MNGGELVKKKFGLNADIVTGIVILLIAAGAYYATFDFAQPDVPWTAESFPRLICWGMAIVGAVILISGLFQGKGEKFGEPRDVLRVLAIIAAAVAYLFVLPSVGFIPATIALLAIALLCYTNRNVRVIVLVSAISPVVIYLVFRYLLNVRLP